VSSEEDRGGERVGLGGGVDWGHMVTERGGGCGVVVVGGYGRGIGGK